MRSFKILIVDDDGEFLATLTELLENAGHEVTCVKDGRKALHLMKVQKVELVIADMLMPDFDGAELIMGIRKEHSAVPVIAISGGGILAPSKYLAIAKRLGAVTVLQKPFPLEKLLAAIQSSMADA